MFAADYIQPLPDDASPGDALAVHLYTWASEADVLLYALFVNSVLAKHKRAHLRPAISPQMQVPELQRQFVGMQWERPKEMGQ